MDQSIWPLVLTAIGSVITIIASTGGIVWMQTTSLNKRIDDAKEESSKAHEGISQRI